MITNREQYEITAGHLGMFSSRLKEMREEGPGSDPALFRIKLGGLEAVMDDLRGQMDSYDRLLSAEPPSEADRATDIPALLIRARISSGMTEGDLAGRAGLQEADIRRYESTGYVTAKTPHVRGIAGALGVHIRDGLLRGIDLDDVHGRLGRAGIPPYLAYGVLHPDLLDCVDDPGGATDLTRMRLAESLAHLFGMDVGWPAPGGSGAIWPDDVTCGPPGSIKAQRPPACAIYAGRVAGVMARMAGRAAQGVIPDDPRAVLRSVRDGAGGITLAGVLDYAWGMGVPTAALCHPGLFHGASLCRDGRHVILLNEAPGQEPRWIFAMLHGIYHASRGSGTIHMLPQGMDDEAGAFASEVMLDGRPGELVDACLAGGSGAHDLRRAVSRVARDENVAPGILAWRVGRELGMDLGPDDGPGDLHGIVNDALLGRSDLGCLDGQEMRLLQSALYYGPSEWGATAKADPSR